MVTIAKSQRGDGSKEGIVCVCLDFLKPKTHINKKVGNKMRLAESKT